MIISIIIIVHYIGGLYHFWYNRVYFFLPSAFGDTRRETLFIKAYANHTMLTPFPTQCLRSQLISAGRGQNWSDLIRYEKLDRLLWQSNLNFRLFENPKILKFSGPYLLSMTWITDLIYSNFRSLLLQMMIVISFPHGHASSPSYYNIWNKRHKLVQSLTKLNNKM